MSLLDFSFNTREQSATELGSLAGPSPTPLRHFPRKRQTKNGVDITIIVITIIILIVIIITISISIMKIMMT